MELLKKKKRFTYADLLKMYNYGIIDNHELVELLHGELFRKTTDDTLYELTLDRLKDVFYSLIQTNEKFQRNYIVNIQNPIFISEENIPLPDIAVVNAERLKEGTFPEPKDIEMLIEISEINHYTGIKLSLYRKYKIKQVLVIDPKNFVVEFHRNMNDISCIREKNLNSRIEIFDREVPISQLLP